MTQTMTMGRPMRPKTGSAWDIPLAVAMTLLLALTTHGCGWLLGEPWGAWHRWLEIPQLIALIPLVALLVATVATRKTEGEPWVLPVAATIWGSALVLSVMVSIVTGVILFFQWLTPIPSDNPPHVVLAAYLLAILASLGALLSGVLLGFQDELGDRGDTLAWRAKIRWVLEDALERAGCLLHGINLMALVLTVPIGPLLTAGVIAVLWLTFCTGAVITGLRQMSR